MQLIKIRSAGGSHISRKCSEEGAASVQRATRSLPPGWKEAPLCAWNPVVGKAVCSQVILIELIYYKQNKPLIADCSFEKKNKKKEHKHSDRLLHNRLSSTLPGLSFPYFCHALCSVHQNSCAEVAGRVGS